MKFNFLIAIAILICFLIAAMAFVIVTVQGNQPALNPGQATLSGVFTDKDYLGVPGVAVTLYEAELDNTTGEYTDVGIADVPGNPQTTNADANLSAIGVYKFTNVRPGTYNVTGLKDGYRWSGIVDVPESGTTTFNVHSNDYVSSPSTYTNNIALPDYQLPRTSPSPAPTAPGYSLSGFVIDKNKNGIPGASVTLYEAAFNNSSGGFDNVKLADVADNPQLTISDPTVAGVGTYTYFNVPAGLYNLTAEKDGHSWFTNVNVTGTWGAVAADIMIPDYVRPA